MRSLPLHRATHGPGALLALAGLVSMVAVGGLAACSNDKKAQQEVRMRSRAFQPAPAWDAAARPVSQTLPVGDYTGNNAPRLIGTQRLHAGDREPISNTSGASAVSIFDAEPGRLFRVKYAANNANAQEVLRVLISEFLQRPFVLDPKIQGTITLEVDQEMTPSDVMDLVTGVCALYGWYAEDQAGTVYVRPADNPKGSISRGPAAILAARSAVDTDSIGIRVRTLRYISPETLKGVIQPLLTEGATVAAVGRTIVMVDTIRQINKVSRLLASLDVAAFDGVSIWTYRLATKPPEEAAKLLDAIAAGSKLAGSGLAGVDPLVTFVPITGTDRLMVISRDESVQSMVREFIQQVDRKDIEKAQFRYVYNIQHYQNPEKLVSLLQQFFAERMDTTPQSQPGEPISKPGTGARIIYDPDDERLLIHATPEDYADIIATLSALDQPRQQVHLNSVIAEVGLTGSLKFGVEYFLRALDEDGFGILDLAGTPGLPDIASAGAFFVGADGLAIVQALDTESDVKILSQPKVTIRDRDEGSIQVGGSVPVVKGDIDSNTSTDGTTGIRREIEYRDTGVILKVTPRINESGQVTLKISQEVNEVGNQTDLGPEFTTRKIETTVIVPHGMTLVLGGINSDTTRNTKTKIPGLGDVPVVGAAFSTTDNRDSRTELLLTITPTIINSPGQGGAILSDFLVSAHAVRQALEDDYEDLPRAFLYEADMTEQGMTPLLEPAPAAATFEPEATPPVNAEVVVTPPASPPAEQPLPALEPAPAPTPEQTTDATTAPKPEPAPST